jgi:hypothetical protein
MLTYPLDLNKPYSIIDHDPVNEIYKVLGTAKNMHSKQWTKGMITEFGGHQSIFVMRKMDFLTKDQKAKLRWIKRHLGQRLHDVELKKIYDSVITGHTYYNT